jgi:hypothetical protein
MTDETELWEDAHVPYPDWQGSVQLEEDRGEDNDLYQLVGLDPEAWSIIGLDLRAAENLVALHVLAIDTKTVPDGSGRIARTAEASGGELPVTSFEVHVDDPWAVLQAVAHRVNIRLRDRNTSGLPIRVVEYGDTLLSE